MSIGQKGVTLIFTAAFICLSLAVSNVKASENKLLKKGVTAPLFSLPTLTGKREMLSVWAGENLSKPYINDKKHTVIISFWATYCVPCKKEIPQLHEFYDMYKDKDIKVFLISIDSKGAAIVKPHVESAGYTLPVLLDPYKRTADRYGVKSVPSLFVINKEGKIIYSAKGLKQDENLIEILENVIFKSGEANSETSSTAITPENTVKSVKPTTEIPSRNRWKAVAAVECGASLDSVAASLGVTTSQIKKWYTDIKNAAIKLWGK